MRPFSDILGGSATDFKGWDNMFYISDVYYKRGILHSVDRDSLVLQQALTSQGRVFMAAVCGGTGGMEGGERVDSGMEGRAWSRGGMEGGAWSRDGMEGGELASGCMAGELVTWFYDGLLEAVAEKKAIWIIRRSGLRKIYQIQRRIQRFADKRALTVGTTLSLLVIWEKRYMIWHLGDCRIYRFAAHGMISNKRGSMKLMTKDHVDEKGRLEKCVGSQGYFVPDFRFGSIKKGEAFLLCSGGFIRKMNDSELSAALSPKDITEDKIRRRLSEIGRAAARRGEGDDISAVYVKVC